jgi:hypothetical protein
MFTCVVNNLGGYRVSADLAPARVRALTLLSLSLSHSHSHSPWLSLSVCFSLCVYSSWVFFALKPFRYTKWDMPSLQWLQAIRYVYFSLMKITLLAHMRCRVMVSSEWRTSNSFKFDICIIIIFCLLLVLACSRFCSCVEFYSKGILWVWTVINRYSVQVSACPLSTETGLSTTFLFMTYQELRYHAQLPLYWVLESCI